MGAGLSKEKGKRGEREVCAILKERGYESERTQRGVAQAEDVTGVPGWSIEVKRTERFAIRPSWAQARRQAGDRVPVVATRWNGGEWLAVVPLGALLDLRAEVDRRYGPV